MQCSEIQERFVDLLYNEQGTPAADPQLREHIRSCLACQKELAELKGLQEVLKVWQDEKPLRPIALPPREQAQSRIRMSFWPMLRYAAITVLVALAFLGLANADIRWDSNGFSFKTALLSPSTPPANTYTKEEVLAIAQRILDKSQDSTLLMMQQMMATIDQDRLSDLQFVRSKLRENRNKN